MQIALFFLVAFVISWGGILLIVGPNGFGGVDARSDPRFPFVYLAMLAGPVVSGLSFTALSSTTGFRDLASRLLRWRVAGRWYAVALLTAPVLVLTALALLWLASPRFVPGILTSQDKFEVVLFGLLIGLGAGILEELGWTGFGLVHLRRRFGILTTGLTLGFLWAAWHVLAAVWGIGDLAGAVPLILFVPIDLLALLPVYRVLMVWVYDRTQSLLLSMLMHASLTTTLLTLGPTGVSGPSQLVYDLVLSAILWTVVTFVVIRGPARRIREQATSRNRPVEVR